jgi:hypothetical protein
MDAQVDPSDLELIQRIIDEEERSALEDFRKGRFEIIAWARFRQGQDRSRREPFLLRHLTPALIIGLVIVVVATIMMLTPVRPSTILTAKDVMAFGRALEGSPGSQVLFCPVVPAAVLPGALADTLNSFFKVVDLSRQPGPGREAEFPRGRLEGTIPRLSFRDKVMLLYRDKVIERALRVVLDKSKEA